MPRTAEQLSTISAGNTAKAIIVPVDPFALSRSIAFPREKVDSDAASWGTHDSLEDALSRSLGPPSDDLDTEILPAYRSVAS